jgi:GAF domain-containing protein
LRIGSEAVVSAGTNPYANILGIATAIVSSMTWRDTLNTVAEKIGQTLFGYSASINSFDPDRRTITYEGYWCVDGATQEDLDYIGHVSFLDDRPDFKPLVEDRLVVEAHVDDPSLHPAEREVMKEWGIKTTLDGPLIYDGKTIGTVGVAETRFVRHFTPSELDLFAQLCELASIGVHSAQTARSREAADRRLAAVAALGERLPQAGSDEAKRAAILEVTQAAFEATTVALSAADASLSGPVVQRADDDGLDAGARADMAAQDEAVAVRLLVPITAHGEPLATLVSSWSDGHRRVSDGEVAIARVIAGQAALALG